MHRNSTSRALLTLGTGQHRRVVRPLDYRVSLRERLAVLIQRIQVSIVTLEPSLGELVQDCRPFLENRDFHELTFLLIEFGSFESMIPYTSSTRIQALSAFLVWLYS